MTEAVCADCATPVRVQVVTDWHLGEYVEVICPVCDGGDPA
ncbi:hypothetical protein [Halobaculum sp. EA56]